MKRRLGQNRQLRRTLLLAAALFPLVLLAPVGAWAATLHPVLIVPKTSPGSTPDAFARTADGTLHVAYETNTSWGMSANGIGAISISPSGQVGAAVQALSWSNSDGGGSPNGVPGLAVLGGSLNAVFGPSPNGGPQGPWAISSSDGGSTWSAPADVGSGPPESVGGSVTLQSSNGTPVLATGCCGGLWVQQGFGAGTPAYQLTNNADGCAGNPDSAVDAATGAVVVSWDSCQSPGGPWFQQVAPSEGAALKPPLPSQYGSGIPLIIAGRDSGPGVFAAYPADYGNTTHITLQQYGGGSIPVGSVKNLHANNWGAATGPDGRIWIFWWGQNTKNGKTYVAVTRSNKAVTKFEPIQVFGFNWSILLAMEGDGRLGPLDMLLNGTAAGSSVGGIYWQRFQPELTAHVSIHKLSQTKFSVKVKVTDAGDPVPGATASAKGHHKTTNSNGVAKLILKGSTKTHLKVKVSDAPYRTLKIKVKL